MNASTVYLLDASIYIFQAHFSPYQRAESQAGEDRSAFIGFCHFLLRFLRTTQSSRLAVAFDESLFCGFRHQLYPQYKANRALPDENLARQLEACARLCDLLGIPGFASRVYEADDIIGTLAAIARRSDAGEPASGDEPTVAVVSRDKDLAQVLRGEQDYLWDFQRNLRRNRRLILEHYSINPEQFPCFLGLTGDSIDCIPGVPGIGKVAATALLGQFDSMPAIYRSLEQVAELPFRGARSTMARLEQYRQQAELSRQLATIVEVAPDPTEPFSCMSSQGLSRSRCDEQGFARLLAELQISERETRRLCTQLAAMEQGASPVPLATDGL